MRSSAERNPVSARRDPEPVERKAAKRKAANQNSVERKNGGKLRILFVSEYFYPRAAGGEVWSWELCTSLVKAGHEVTVITGTHDPSLKEDDRVQGVRIIRKAAIPDVGRRVARWLAARKIEREVKRYLEERREQVDIIHTMAYALSTQVSRIAQKHRIPCITSVHSYFGRDWSKAASGFVPTIVRIYEKHIIKSDRSAVMHVPSKYLQENILNDTGKTTIVLHNWLPDKFPKPQKLVKGTCLFVGSLEKIKNPLACIDAVGNLKGARLIVIGTGSLDGEMRKLAAKRSIDCEFLGSLPHDETLAYIGGASLLLVPSINESFSIAALEAVAQGTPVSGTPVGIIPELPGACSFPPTQIPQRISEATQRSVRSTFAKEKILGEITRLYLRTVKKDNRARSVRSQAACTCARKLRY
jgi:glycosyltransferase involved in cell wall biosynthesis